MHFSSSAPLLLLALGLGACSQATIPAATNFGSQSVTAPKRLSSGLLVKHFSSNNGIGFTGMQVESALAVTPFLGTRFDIWNAMLTPPTPGTYTFTVTTTAKVELLLNGIPVLTQMENEDGHLTTTTGTAILDGPAEFMLRYAHTARTPNLLFVTWGQSARTQSPIPSARFSPRDLTADCDVQPLTNCRARFTVPYSMLGVIIGQGSMTFQHPVQNLSEIYPLMVRLESSLPLTKTSFSVAPLQLETVNYEVSCPNTYNDSIELKTVRLPDQQAQSNMIQVLCYEKASSPF